MTSPAAPTGGARRVRGTGTDTVAGLRSAQAAYRALGWPITRHHHEIRLDLDDAVALAIPASLATTVAEILMERRCPPPVLAHPALPAHGIILAGDRYCIALPWPTGIHRVTDTLLLPPTVTAHGPVRWVLPPQRHALRLCREIDVLAALRTATHEDPPPPAPTRY